MLIFMHEVSESMLHHFKLKYCMEGGKKIINLLTSQNHHMLVLHDQRLQALQEIGHVYIAGTVKCRQNCFADSDV